ncbi:MAG: flagellar biosynthetic protein FliO [Bradymonadia bacterium]
MSVRHNVSVALGAMMMLLAGLASAEGTLPMIDGVDHVVHAEGRTFRFTADHPLTAEGAEAFTDGVVLGLRLTSAKVRKSWPEFEDARINRTLMFQSHQKADSVVLRVRFTDIKGLPKSFAKKVRFEVRKGAVLAHVPPLPGEDLAGLGVSSARAVAHVMPAPEVEPALLVKAPEPAAPAVAVKAVDPGPDPLRTESRPTIKPAVAPTAGATFLAQIDAPEPKAPEAADPAPVAEDVPAKPVVEVPSAETLAAEALETPAAAPELETAAPVRLEEALITEPETPAKLHANNIGAQGEDLPFDWSLIGVLAFALFGLWGVKKLRRRQPGAIDGRLIKPLSSHLLGPRHGLLLVDVAGEHVLLGTSDKGVQMLTKINPNTDSVRALEADSIMVDHPTPKAITDKRSGKGTASKARAAFSQVLNSVTGRVPMLEDDEVPVTERPERRPRATAPQVSKVTSTGGNTTRSEDDALLAMAAQVQDGLTSSQSRNTVTRGPHTRPIDPVELPEANGEEEGVAADLLTRIRQLQGA